MKSVSDIGFELSRDNLKDHAENANIVTNKTGFTMGVALALMAGNSASMETAIESEPWIYIYIGLYVCFATSACLGVVAIWPRRYFERPHAEKLKEVMSDHDVETIQEWLSNTYMMINSRNDKKFKRIKILHRCGTWAFVIGVFLQVLYWGWLIWNWLIATNLL